MVSNNLRLSQQKLCSPIWSILVIRRGLEQNIDSISYYKGVYMHRIKKIIFALTHPSHWIRNYKYSKQVDTWFDTALLDPCFDIHNEYEVSLNGVKIWCRGHPYAVHLITTETSPSRYNVERFKDALDQYIFTQKLKWNN